ncbi:MAG: hypothetical protein CMJ75_20820, partial [Planctomycetaceae bacterium]|nr:hypothetical protein [Planctomycetaceae bacterium]
MHTWSTFAAVLVLAVAPGGALSAKDAASSLPAAFQAHCIKCHGQENQVEGETNLLKIKSDKDLEAQPQLLEKLIQVLKNGDMPPPDATPLPKRQRQQIVSSLHVMIQRVRASQPFIPTPIRRMNRFQYNNAVVDLLELDRDLFRLNERLLRRRDDYFQPATGKMPPEVKVSSRPLSKDIDNQRPEGFRGVAAFPQDKRAEHGFDNRADHLTLSPLLMESFLRLSQTIVESADLNPKECRSWDRLFAPPNKAEGTPAEGRSADETPEIDAVRSRLKSLLRRAFRRPVDPPTLERFTQFAQQQFHAGADFEQTMRTLVGAILGMPDFLYFYESDTTQKTSLTNPGRQRVTDFELASRLAQFLWSSIPDDPLLDLAAAGRLSDPQILGAQIERMMNDSRSSRFCDNFPAQWLQLDRLITSIPDPQKFPYFYYSGYRTSMHMLSEPLLLFETVYVENLSVMDLLDPDFTWESNMLRANYAGHSKGDHQVNVQSFKRVPLEDPR